MIVAERLRSIEPEKVNVKTLGLSLSVAVKNPMGTPIYCRMGMIVVSFKIKIRVRDLVSFRFLGHQSLSWYLLRYVSRNYDNAFLNFSTRRCLKLELLKCLKIVHL